MVALMATMFIGCSKDDADGEEVDNLDYIEVSSLEELIPYLSQSRVAVRLAPGTYRVTEEDMLAGKYNTTTVIGDEEKVAILLVSGNLSTYDFTDVTLEIDAKAWNAHSYGEFVNLHITGSTNTVKNLTVVDDVDGNPQYYPKNGCTNVIIDGINNLVQGIEIHSTGSYPYGYGELFGKGAPYVIKHFKHCALLIRGDYNKVKNCNVYHKAYGHFIFMQAAENVTIEGCYIEGEMTTTDAVLAEEGTGSAADNVGFLTYWGYTVPAGYTICLGEDGIRTYNAGNTIMNGEVTSRGSKNITVKDCTVKHARAGMSLTLSSGTKYVENVTLIGCQSGFAVGGSDGEIVNCKADAAFGPAYVSDYASDKRITADITVIPYEGETYAGNGSKQLAIIYGSYHNITLRKGSGLEVDPELEITVGGDSNKIGELGEVNEYAAPDMTIVNETGYKMTFTEFTTGCTITTNGEIFGGGSYTDNNVTVK